MEIDPKIKKKILQAQKNEITENKIYHKLAHHTKRDFNDDILHQIAEDELRHYNLWKKYTGVDIKPSQFKIWRYYWIAKLLGITFGIKLMERGEKQAQGLYRQILAAVPETQSILDDEQKHEKILINSIQEEGLRYVGSIVLGLNDALVELTGVLAGLTLALQNTRLIAVTGFITGIAASFSMAASEYLSTKTEANDKHALRASIYTGVAYIFTVLFLIFPYLVSDRLYLDLAWTIANAIMVILFFTFYISVARDLSFKKRFLEMASISLGIALITFGIGFLVRQFIGVEI
ncbi:MAG: VIT1/CCC1 transporter family protein [Patescibacteria group bacterium]|nr:VIT1/CCC1 transporter family protein [Patescibacteria group bacterium]